MKFLKLLIIAFSVFFLVSCEKTPQEAEDVTSKLVSMKSYQTNANIMYISDKSISEYTGIHYADSDGRYAIEITEPQENAGDKIIFDSKMIWHTSKANQDKISVAMPDRPERQQIMLFAFIKNMLNSTNTQNTTDGNYTILCAELPDIHKFMKTEKLWINNETSLPEKLIIYDENQKERVKVSFSDFKYNQEIDPDIFTLQTEE